MFYMDADRSAWADVIRTARESFSMTQQQLADASGISLKTISNIELGVTKPQSGKLRSVLSALGLSSDLAIARVQASEPKEVDTEADVVHLNTVNGDEDQEPSAIHEIHEVQIEGLFGIERVLVRTSDPESIGPDIKAAIAAVKEALGGSSTPGAIAE